MLHALLKHIETIGINEKVSTSKGVYAVESGDDDCLLVLGYFLTDGGSPDRFKNWIESNEEGEVGGKVVYIQKYGDQMRVNLEPLVTHKKATLVTNKFELLNAINRFNELITDSPAFILIKRDNGKIVLEQIKEMNEGPMADFK